MKQKGFTLIELMIVVAIIAIIASIAIPNLLRSKMSANEASAIGSLRTIATAEEQFRASGILVVGGTRQYGNLTALGTAIPPFLGANIGASNTPAKSGYNFAFSLGASTIAPSFSASADAASANSGSRNFFIDETGEMKWLPQSAGTADETSPTLQ